MPIEVVHITERFIQASTEWCRVAHHGLDQPHNVLACAGMGADVHGGRAFSTK